tara:strand:+ start:827 stop:1120 length:294 start_codon:yes stop_codon:yes gene_type:complete
MRPRDVVEDARSTTRAETRAARAARMVTRVRAFDTVRRRSTTRARLPMGDAVREKGWTRGEGWSGGEGWISRVVGECTRWRSTGTEPVAAVNNDDRG